MFSCLCVGSFLESRELLEGWLGRGSRLLELMEISRDGVILLPASSKVITIVQNPERLGVFHKVTKLEDGRAELISQVLSTNDLWWAGAEGLTLGDKWVMGVAWSALFSSPPPTSPPGTIEVLLMLCLPREDSPALSKWPALGTFCRLLPVNTPLAGATHSPPPVPSRAFCSKSSTQSSLAAEAVSHPHPSLGTQRSSPNPERCLIYQTMPQDVVYTHRGYNTDAANHEYRKPVCGFSFSVW